MRAVLVTCSALALHLFASAPPAHTQGAAPTTGPCETFSDPLKVTETLPLDLLDHLEKISASTFVHAFLVAYVAERGDTAHVLTRCAVQFLREPPDSVVKLRANRVKPVTLIRALREAERNRMREEELRALLRVSLDTVVTSLLRSPQEAVLPIYTSLLASADTACTTGPHCDALEATRKAIENLRTANAVLGRITDERDRLIRQLDAGRSDLAIARTRVEAESVALQAIREALAAATTEEERRRLESDSLRAAEQLETSTSARGSADTLLRALSSAAQRIEQDLPSATARVATAVSDVSKSLYALHAILRDSSRSIRDAQLKLSDRQDVRANSLVAPAPTAGTSMVPQARAASVLMELTDFVIDRAKQEVMLSYLATLYTAMRRDTVLQNAFPGTHQLMRGLTVPDMSRLSVVAAGRIPLTVWRATLRNDFHSLPINFLLTPDSVLCRGSHFDACRDRVAQLLPVAGVVRVLLEGQPVLEVIRDAAQIATASSSSAPRAGDLFIQALQVVSAVAATYQTQGLALNADPIRHPFVLSVSAMRVVGEKQLSAFVRLLLLDVIPATETRITLNTARLPDAARRATMAIEVLATATNSTESTVEQARRLLGAAVSALRAADGIATLLRNDDPSAGKPGIRQFFLDVAEPLVVRDYALAMSRTAVLLHELTGGPMSRNLLTLASLASSLAEAQSGAEMRTALETAASPVGGWQAKRYREGGQTSITAFPGFAYGGEWLKNGPYSRTAGAALPIGPEYQFFTRSSSASAAPGCWLRFICSVGAFMPIIDLGTLLSYRLDKSDAVKSEPNTGFRQVVAPGGYLTLGLWHSAFALLLGGQFMPSMREVQDGSDITGHAWRAGAALTVDVMLFSF